MGRLVHGGGENSGHPLCYNSPFFPLVVSVVGPCSYFPSQDQPCKEQSTEDQNFTAVEGLLEDSHFAMLCNHNT
jgi:hypothetical protein